jgi:hypothetical protein
MLVWWVRDKPDIRHRGGLAIYYRLDHYYATPIVNVTIHSPHVSWLTEMRNIVPFSSPAPSTLNSIRVSRTISVFDLTLFV